MAESSPPPATSRPRPALIALLAVAVIALVVYMLWPAATPTAGPSNSPGDSRRPAGATADAGTSGRGSAPLEVRLDALKQASASPEEKGRNPFRFYVPPPPPPPPPKPMVPAAPTQPAPQPLPGQPGYRPPPIPLKFIGIVEVKGRKVAVLVPTDGHGMPQYASVGETVLGQYRVVNIGVESVTLEYLDGRGRQTIPMRG